MTWTLKKALALTAVVVALAAGVLAYRTWGDGAGTGTYKIAVMVPETGNLAFIGQPIRNALTLAQEQMQPKLTASGMKIQIIYADTQGNPREAVTQFQRIADLEKADGIITTLSAVITAISPMAKEREMLFVGLTPDPRFLDVNPYALRVLFSFELEGMRLAEMVQQAGWKKVLLLHSTDAASAFAVTKVLAPRLKTAGIAASLDTFDVGQRDFKTLCAKYASQDWDGVIYHGFGSELPFLAQACAAHPRIAGAPKLGPLGSLDVRPELRRNLVGVRFFAPAFIARSTPAYEAFAKAYSERFPKTMLSYSAVYAYDAYALLVEALADKQSKKAQVLKMRLMQPTPALTQSYQFDARGEFFPDTELLEITTDGSFKPAAGAPR